MHLLKDENGNPIPHGGEGHHHEDGGHCHHHGEEGHCHHHGDGEGHGHHHEGGEGHGHHHCGACGNAAPKDETTALLTYMVQHNKQHAAELDQMADNLVKLGMEDAAKTIREGVSDYQKGNMRLELALTLVKAHQQ